LFSMLGLKRIIDDIDYYGRQFSVKQYT